MIKFKIWLRQDEKNTLKLKDSGSTSFDGDEHTMLELLAIQYSNGTLKDKNDRFFSKGDIIELTKDTNTHFYEMIGNTWCRFLDDTNLSFIR